MSNLQFGLAKAFKRIATPQIVGSEILLSASPRLFVMRHGESWGQIRKEYYQELGDERLPITDWGRQQAQEGGELLRDLDIGTFEVWHSTCMRAKETALQAARPLGAENIDLIAPDIRLNKQIFGVFSGLFSDKERQEKYPVEFAAYQRDLCEVGAFQARPPGGESLADMQVKADEFIADIFATTRAPNRNILIVTHGTPGLCIENTLLRHGSSWVLDNLDSMKNCAIRLIEKENGSFTSREIGQGLARPKSDVVPILSALNAGS